MSLLMKLRMNGENFLLPINFKMAQFMRANGKMAKGMVEGNNSGLMVLIMKARGGATWRMEKVD